MSFILTPDDIDFSQYERETEPMQKVKPAGMYVQELIDRLRNPPRPNHRYMPWGKTYSLFQFRPGEVTIWGGANGNGKSMVTGFVSLGMLAQGERCCIASFEMKPIRTLERMARQFSGYNPMDPAFAGSAEATKALVNVYGEFQGWTDNRLWLYDQQGTVTAKQVCAVARYCAKELGVTQMFIDSLMKCVQGEDDYNGQKAFVDELTAIARDHSIHIHLVHHIKKPASEDQKPGKYDFKGTGAITDQVDNVIAVWRNKPKERKQAEGKLVEADEPDCLLICDKQRNGEWEGTIGLWFDKASQQYLPGPGMAPMEMSVPGGMA
ncbi:DnaB-like helicase C-terminal domain-containing protein [Comamonas humi]